VAVVDFADPRYEATREEALAIGLSPLEELWLPGRALPVDGLFPGERGYPFTRELVARVRASDPEEARVLSLWLEASREPGLAGTARSASQESPTQERPWLLGAVGDIQIGPDEAPLLFQGRRGLRALFGDVLGELERPELLVGNLEGPVTSGGLPNPRKRFQFRFPPGTTAALAAAGFDLLLFANNHVLDYGEEGLLSTLEDSRQSGLPLVGAGRNEDEALGGASLVAPGGGARLRFFGFARYPREARGFTTEEAEAGAAKPGTNSDEAATMEAIRQARAAGEVVVLLCHGGNEYRFDPSEEIRTRYRGFIDAGASLVLASHPHVLQGVEAYHDGLIAYSLGNFLFTGESEPFMAEEGGMLRILVYKGRICGLDLLPIFSGYYGTSKSGLPRDTLKAFAARTRILSGK
jgi:poly-gamma-glutamate synthesis protein (capsule biosynthesis protein)